MEIIYCSDLKKSIGEFSCCDSCHDDEYEGDGFGLIEGKFKGKPMRICCNGFSYIEDSMPLFKTVEKKPEQKHKLACLIYVGCKCFD